MCVHTGLNATTSLLGPIPPPAGTPSFTNIFLISFDGYAKVTCISCFKSLSLPIFCLGYFETTASTFFVPNPGIPERRIVAVAIAPPLIERNWRRVVRQLVRHSLSLFSILSIKIHLPFFWSKATMSPFYANTVGLLHTVYFFGCQSAIGA